MTKHEHHFMVTEPMSFTHNDNLRTVFNDEGERLLGLIKRSAHGKITPIKGRVLDRAPLDPRVKMPLTVNGVNLYWGEAFFEPGTLLDKTS